MTGGITAAVFAARVARVRRERLKCPTRVLPDAAPFIPVKAQSPKCPANDVLTVGRKLNPYPRANDFRQFVLLRQLRFQKLQNLFRGQSAIGIVLRHVALLRSVRLFGSAQEPLI